MLFYSVASPASGRERNVSLGGLLFSAFLPIIALPEKSQAERKKVSRLKWL